MPGVSVRMLNDDPKVSEMLERVMSRAHDPAQSSKSQPSATEHKNDTPASDCEEAREWWLPGICGQTHVTTNFGQVPAQLLRVGDRVRTSSGRYRAIKRIRETKLDSQFIERHPDARPVLIPEGALAQNLPMQDVILSPAQVIFVSMTLESPKEFRAKDLARSSQAVDKTLGMVSYFELSLDTEDNVSCEGIWVKSAGVQ